jgi:dihydrofolate reductase
VAGSFSAPRAGVRPHPSRKRTLGRQGGTTFTFVTEGIESALGQAVAAAGDKGVRIAGGANSAQQFIEAYARETAATDVWEGNR